jgi:hypothetical protein
MRRLFTIAVAGLTLSLVPSPAPAQTMGSGTYRGAVPGYYYSAGGYSGGYYFSPGYYRNPAAPRVVAPTAVAPAGGYYGMSAYRSRGGPAGYYDYTTGRDNLSIPLAKPWLRPLR